jgi:tyrosine-protein phosphatase 2/3
MPPDYRSSSDRTPVHYTMKTSRQPVSSPTPSHTSHSHAHSHTNAQAFRANNKSTTPMASPAWPHSVGQSHPPKISPSTATRLSAHAQESPNYFGLVVDQPTDPRDSSNMPRTNWSPPSSSIKSFAAALPQPIPLDANPEFEAFRRQADANSGASFSLNGAHLPKAAPGTPFSRPAAKGQPLLRPQIPRWHTHGSDTGSEMSLPRPKPTRDFSSRMDVDADSNSLHDSAYVSADSKRNSQASLNPPSLFNMPRQESPAQFDRTSDSRTNLSKVEDRHPRLSMAQGKADHAGAEAQMSNARANTEPVKLETGTPTLLSPPQLREILEGPLKDSLLLLDIRVATHYVTSRIKGALNLCIPTTLLKRPSFTLRKLQDTFQSAGQQEEFAAWREKAYLVVYDSNSVEKRDAGAALNMLKKFTNEGYAGHACVLRGGFNNFEASYPYLVDHEASVSPSTSAPLALGGGQRPYIAPVIGGVTLPKSTNTANPFFANIRQNMDLADGVGQLDIAIPANLKVSSLPSWLRMAADSSDKGKVVSDKFLGIERAEQSRMKNAYSIFKPGPAGADDTDNVQLSGIEKGVKNRYKDILPFEHARVKLEGRPNGDCDYVNASHIKATRSNKRYIASQGPLPATFEVGFPFPKQSDIQC